MLGGRAMVAGFVLLPRNVIGFRMFSLNSIQQSALFVLGSTVAVFSITSVDCNPGSEAAKSDS